MRVWVESLEVATLKPDGRPWDGPGGPRLRGAELQAFFGLDLTHQLEQLVLGGSAPTPPDAYVRIYAGGQPVVQTPPQKSFEARWDDAHAAEAALPEGTQLRVQVWDEDVLFHDLVGETTTTVPRLEPTGDRMALLPFGQVRKLVLRFAP
jgi:hypothetical protein